METFYAKQCTATMKEVLFVFVRTSHNAVTWVIRHFIPFMCVMIMHLRALERGKKERKKEKQPTNTIQRNKFCLD